MGYPNLPPAGDNTHTLTFSYYTSFWPFLQQQVSGFQIARPGPPPFPQISEKFCSMSKECNPAMAEWTTRITTNVSRCNPAVARLGMAQTLGKEAISGWKQTKRDLKNQR
jgi:hypothetical protein